MFGDAPLTNGRNVRLLTPGYEDSQTLICLSPPAAATGADAARFESVLVRITNNGDLSALTTDAVGFTYFEVGSVDRARRPPPYAAREAAALGDEAGTLGDETATLGDEAATLGDEAATLGDEAAPVPYVPRLPPYSMGPGRARQ